MVDYYVEVMKHLKFKEGLGSRLAADVDDIVGVGEAVELGGRALGVSTHLLKVEPVTDVEDGVEVGALGDAVDAVAGRAPDGVLDTFASGCGVSGRSLVDSPSTSAKDLGNGVLVVEHDVGKVTVDAVINVYFVTLSTESGILVSAASNDVASNGEGSGDVVTAWLGNDFDVVMDREEFVESAAENCSHFLKGIARETTSDIESAHAETKLIALLEN